MMIAEEDPKTLEKKDSHQHHFHNYRGPLMMVLPDGHVYQKCCKCPKTRTIHVEHA